MGEGFEIAADEVRGRNCVSDMNLRPEGASERARYVLAFDTANEIIAIGLGVLHVSSCMIELTASR